MNDSNSQWLIPSLLAAALIGGVLYWYYRIEPRTADTDPIAGTPEPVPDTRASKASGPSYPMPLAGAPRPELTTLPLLSESDEYFKMDMVNLFGNGMAELLADSAVIEKIVATVDNIPRDHVSDRIKPISNVAGPFLADGQDGSGHYAINPANYDRYDFMVNLLATADIAVIAEIYRRFYPLFQEAYADLGYPQGYFNDRVIEVIDHLLATPEIPQSAELVRPHVLYEFADPDVEALSGGQKAMLRLGGSHAVRVKQFLEELRVQIASPAT